MSKVLAFGDDRSPEADRAWDWIVSHRWDGWRLEVVTAEPPADMRPVETQAAELHSWEPEVPRDAAENGFQSVEHLHADVDPRVALIAKPWDLVAIGPRGSGMLKTLHLGSTADWLLRAPVSPLVVVRQPGPVRKVLVATDGSSHANSAVDTLSSLPWLEGTTVRVVAIKDRVVDTEAALGYATGVLTDSGAGIDAETLDGRPTPTVIGEIERFGPDLVVMGVRGLSGVKRLVVGSTTAAVAGAVDRSLLVAHAQDEPAG